MRREEWGHKDYLTLVTLHVEILLQCHHTHCLILPRLWHDRFTTHGAAWSILPVTHTSTEATVRPLQVSHCHVSVLAAEEQITKKFKWEKTLISTWYFVDSILTLCPTDHMGNPSPFCSKITQVWGNICFQTPHEWAFSIPVVVIHTMRLVGLVHNKGSPLEWGVAHHTGEALGMVWVTSGLQHPIRDGLFADTALFQGSLNPKKTRQHYSNSPSPGDYTTERWNRRGKGKEERLATASSALSSSFHPSDSQHSSLHRRASHPHCRTAAPAAASHIWSR